MPAAFREVFPFAGVDEHTAAGNVGIIVPLKGSNLVILADGPALKVAPTLRPAVRVDEITDPHYFPTLVSLQTGIAIVDVLSTLVVEVSSGFNLSYKIAMLNKGVYRLFKITGHSLVGIDKVVVQATHTRTSKVEATLKVLVLEQKLIKISIRPMHIRDNWGNVISFTNAPVDTQTSSTR